MNVQALHFSSLSKGLTGVELPVDFKVLDNGYMYVKLYSFFDSTRLTIQLWERMITALNQASNPRLDY